MGRLSVRFSVLLVATIQFTASGALAQEMALMPGAADCPSQEPDSVQISWVDPCENGNWLLDTKLGCRMWDWHPDHKDRAAWTGQLSSPDHQRHATVARFAGRNLPEPPGRFK